MKAIWNEVIIADSDETIVIEGNHYFPEDSLRMEYFKGSNTHTVCPWKGTASYYHISVNDKVNEDAAWYYPETSKLAESIRGRVAFWKGVKVER